MPLLRRCESRPERSAARTFTGNVYRHLSDFTPFDLRSSYGIGLRIRTPYVVLRLDYGLKFSPRPGERGGKFFGSIGQAF